MKKLLNLIFLVLLLPIPMNIECNQQKNNGWKQWLGCGALIAGGLIISRTYFKKSMQLENPKPPKALPEKPSRQKLTDIEREERPAISMRDILYDPNSYTPGKLAPTIAAVKSTMQASYRDAYFQARSNYEKEFFDAQSKKLTRCLDQLARSDDYENNRECLKRYCDEAGKGNPSNIQYNLRQPETTLQAAGYLGNQLGILLHKLKKNKNAEIEKFFPAQRAYEKAQEDKKSYDMQRYYYKKYRIIYTGCSLLGDALIIGGSFALGRSTISKKVS